MRYSGILIIEIGSKDLSTEVKNMKDNLNAIERVLRERVGGSLQFTAVLYALAEDVLNDQHLKADAEAQL